jgi:hypothetical protein
MHFTFAQTIKYCLISIYNLNLYEVELYHKNNINQYNSGAGREKSINGEFKETAPLIK